MNKFDYNWYIRQMSDLKSLTSGRKAKYLRNYRYYNNTPRLSIENIKDGRREVAIDQALGLFRVAHAVIQQIPVQRVRTPVRVAARAALPLLETHRPVVPKHLSAPRPVLRQIGRRAERRELDLRSGLGEVNHAERVREIQRREHLAARESHTVRTVAREAETPAD